MSITSLPLELLNFICEYLEPQDWGALRITCRHIHGNTLEAYTTRYFKRISLLLTREGLDRLEHIASSKTLRGSVEEIWIIPNLFESGIRLDKAKFTNMENRNHQLRWGGISTMAKSDETQAELLAFVVYKAIMKEQQAILDSWGFFGTLEKCLPRLENAVTFGVRFHATHFLLNTAKHSDLTCLGLRELKSQFNYSVYKTFPMIQRVPYMLYDLPFSQLLNAIIKSNRKVQALQTCGHAFRAFRSDRLCGMNLKSFQLPESEYQLLLPLLKDLTTLHMCIRLKEYEQESFDEKTFKRLLNVLVTVAPTLKTLTFAQWSPIEELSPLYFKNLSQRIQFSQLEELDLHSIEVTVNSLEEFLRTAAPTLKRLSLELVSIVDGITSAPDLGPITENSGSWVSALSAEVKNDMQGLWKRVFESWAQHLKLQYVQLCNLGYRGRYIKLRDHLYTQRGQLDAQPSPGPNSKPDAQPSVLNPLSISFDAERASIPFEKWITQLEIEMWHRTFFGDSTLPGTRDINVRQPGREFSGQVTYACSFGR
ncbi:hypothetical protein N7520_002210 [Penicillium odoratum]|uniref:uncharacterized protein n=1 Tax=Penicillium odoratum TaxID=1167516 RepID=UPI0025480CD6|nr:uncharacterized protein N7520_002210 [Penicillium odoratum]KAJ5771681.1 hypothetical protein N7520_002210 [Penicillium odoratum]